MKKLLILSTLLFASSLLASDLKVGFDDAKWDGITIPKDEVCSDYNIEAGSTPALKISNLPSNTEKIVFTYNDKSFTKMDNGGHGVVSYKIQKGLKEVEVPAIKGETFELENGFESVNAHTGTRFNKVAGAYLAPCSGGKGNTYTVNINAVDAENKTLASAELVLGKY